MGEVPILMKIIKPFPLFRFLAPRLKWLNKKFYIFHLPLFLITLYYCQPNPLLINHIFSWKSKLKQTGVDITCFFPRRKTWLKMKIKPNKKWKVFLEKSYGTSQTSKLEIFRKTVNGLYPKSISVKNPTLEVWKAPN